jgi:hypothetical protein
MTDVEIRADRSIVVIEQPDPPSTTVIVDGPAQPIVGTIGVADPKATPDQPAHPVGPGR